MIDTLILSGGGPSGIAYIGIFKALFKNNIIDSKLTNIKEIITTSVGVLFSILLMTKQNYKIIENLMMGCDINTILNLDDIDINSILLEFGLFSNKKISEFIESYIKNIYKIENITLKRFYEKTNIKLTVKVYNTTSKETEYINYNNNPDLKLSLLCMMTTAIPFFFKPISYNDNLYVDGGLRGSFPIEACESDNYLGIIIKGGTCSFKDNKIIQMFPILNYILSLLNENTNIDKYDKKKIIISEINNGLNFNLDNDTKTILINKGYQSIIDHFKKN
jgi:predicted acylesterase/phospholipase RssA